MQSIVSQCVRRDVEHSEAVTRSLDSIVACTCDNIEGVLAELLVKCQIFLRGDILVVAVGESTIVVLNLLGKLGLGRSEQLPPVSGLVISELCRQLKP